MPRTVVRFQPTPNPNALKCVLDARISEVPRSFFSAQEAFEDRLARELFAAPGVTNVLINDDWITVGKLPDAPWGPIRRAVEDAVRRTP